MSLHAAVDAVGERIETHTRQKMSGFTRAMIIVGLPVRCWRTTTTVIVSVVVWQLAASTGHPGWWGLVGLAALPMLVLGVWAALDRRTFATVGWPFVRAYWRRWLVYAPAWRLWMVRCRLTVRDDYGRHVVPKLVKVTSTPAIDRLHVHVPVGATPGEFAHASDHLANAARALECRVRPDRPARIVVELLVRDLLAKPLPAVPIPATAEVNTVTLGKRDDGLPWTVPVLDVHRLVAGRSRSGKGSLLWGELLGLAPAIAAGLVEVTAIDPKGGMELAVGRELFTRFVYDHPVAMVEAIEALADDMDLRAASLFGVARKFTISADTPLKLLVIDELASLSLYAGPQVGTRFEQALGRILTKGAAPGFLVRGYVQDPKKDTVPLRGLFTHRVALGLDTPSEVDMVLGDGAHDRGAYADRIAIHDKGMAYVIEDGNPTPFRVRAGYPDDDLIRTIAQRYPAPRRHTTPVVPTQRTRHADTAPTLRMPTNTSTGSTGGGASGNGNGQHLYRPGGIDLNAPLLPPNLLAALDRKPTESSEPADDNHAGGQP